MNGLDSRMHKLRIRAIDSLTIGIFIAVVFCFFGPLEIYFNNYNEFWFSITDIAGIVTFYTILCMSVIILFLTVIKEKAYKYASALLMGIGIAMYIQGNFLISGYHLLDGKNENLDNMLFNGIISTIIWICCIFISIIFVNRNEKLFFKISKFISIFITCILLATVLVVGVNNVSKKSEGAYLTKESMFTMSENSNVIVLLLDELDASFLSDYIENNPAIYNQLDGFTYYPDTVGRYPYTDIAVPNILSGQEYNTQIAYDENLKKMYKESSVINELLDKNYSIDLYTSNKYVDGLTSHNIENLENGKTPVGSYKLLSKLLYKTTAYKYAPHYLKEGFRIYSGDFEKAKDTYALNEDAQFYQLLCQNGFKVRNDRDYFKFYHFKGGHAPFLINQNMQETKASTREQQIQGEIRLVVKFLEELKNIKIYDNCSIVIMADHGEKEIRQNPTLLIKPAYSSGKLKTSNMALSYGDLKEIFLSLISDNPKEKSESAIEKLNEKNSDGRYYYFYSWDDLSKDGFVKLTEYESYGKANDILSFSMTGRSFTKEGIEEKTVADYKLGTVLSFDRNGNAFEYVEYGVDPGEYDSSWTRGTKAKLSMNLKTNPVRDLALHINLSSVNPGLSGEQRIRLYINGKLIEEKAVAPEDLNLEFIIPYQEVKKGKTEFVLEFPDAIAPNILGTSEDVRVISISMYSLVLSQAENNFTTLIDFSSNGNSYNYVQNGFYNFEQDFRRTHKVGKIKVALNKEDYKMKVTYALPSFDSYADVYINGNKISTLNNLNEITTAEIVIPSQYLSGKKQIITFKVPDAISPKEAGINEDNRVLGIALYKIELIKNKRSLL
ncbi:MAG: hypothetical protein E7222_13590 [Clostridiales bacterium]|jgi:hypothetical protein|nr:hypothetical protein [Clostridiales bacterium]